MLDVGMMMRVRCAICKNLRLGSFDPDCPRCILKRKWVRNATEMFRRHQEGLCCATIGCNSVHQLEEDRDSPGTLYCLACWKSWEQQQQEREKFERERMLQLKNRHRNVPGTDHVPHDTIAAHLQKSTGVPGPIDFDVFEDPEPAPRSEKPQRTGEPAEGEMRQFGVVLCEHPHASIENDAKCCAKVAANNLKRGRNQNRSHALKPKNMDYDDCAAYEDASKQQKNMSRQSPRSPPRDENVFRFPPTGPLTTPEKNTCRPEKPDQMTPDEMILKKSCGIANTLIRPPPGFADISPRSIFVQEE